MAEDVEGYRIGLQGRLEVGWAIHAEIVNGFGLAFNRQLLNALPIAPQLRTVGDPAA